MCFWGCCPIDFHSAYSYSSYVADTALLAKLGLHDVDADPFSVPSALTTPSISPRTTFFYSASDSLPPTLLIDLLPGRSRESAAMQGLRELCADALLPEPTAGTGFRGDPDQEDAVEDPEILSVILDLFDPEMEPADAEHLILTIMDTNKLWFYRAQTR